MATMNPAKWRGDAEHEGTVEKGKVADLVVLRANPLTAISHTQEVDGVFQRGRYYSRMDLDAMLRRAESKAK
jgi:imidazolonepropionase-like amidohydrolase